MSIYRLSVSSAEYEVLCEVMLDQISVEYRCVWRVTIEDYQFLQERARMVILDFVSLDSLSKVNFWDKKNLMMALESILETIQEIKYALRLYSTVAAAVIAHSMYVQG